MTRSIVAAAVVVLVVATGCGSTSRSGGVGVAVPAPSSAPAASSPTPAQPEPESAMPTTAPISPEWEVIELGRRGDDGTVAWMAAGDLMVLAMSTESGPTAWVDGDGGWVSAPIGEYPGGEAVLVSAAAAVPGGFLVVVNSYETFESELWFSESGLEWTKLSTDGLDVPADILDVTTTSDGVVLLSGALRGGEDPSRGPFRPGMWRSENLKTWTSVPLEGRGGVVLDVNAVESGLVALGQVGGNSKLWRSGTGGEFWSLGPGPAMSDVPGSQFHGLAIGEGLLVAAGTTWDRDGRRALAIVTSSDEGESWVSQSVDPAIAEGLSTGYTVTWAGSAFWIVTTRRFDPFEHQDRCYAEINACGGRSQSVVLRSEDGATWDEVDLSRLPVPEGFRVENVVSKSNGVALIGSADTLFVVSWPFDAAPELAEPPPALEPAVFDLVESGGELQVGVTYRFPLYVHCGVGYLGSFNGSKWHLVGDGPDSIYNPDWPTAGETILGFVTLTDEGTVEYTVPGGEVVATYVASEQDPPGCL